MRAAAILALAVLSATACTETRPAEPDGLANPRSLALACTLGGKVAPLADCPSDEAVAALIGGGTRGSIALAFADLVKLDDDKPASLRLHWVDTDKSVPGFTPLPLPGLPGAMVVDAAAGRAYVVLAGTRTLARLDLAGLAEGTLRVVDSVELAVDPTAVLPSLVLTAGPSPRLFLADPKAGIVWTLLASDLGKGTQPLPLQVGGSPHALAVSTLTGDLYVVHLREAHVTVLDPATGNILARIGTAPACQDGIDNDADGLTDGDDVGCDDPRDTVEGDPENGATACGNGLDDDGDGSADAADLGCTVTAADACRNGIDDDGDGKIDFPADVGCNGHGDGSEWSELPGCRDGFDNDGDGLTDAAEPGCQAAPNGQEAPQAEGAGSLCNDGIDDDGDGQTDFPADSDCPDAGSNAERHGGCADGRDDDGDGATDLADPDCYNRATPSESPSLPEAAALVATTFDGTFAVVADRGRRAIIVIDARTRTRVTADSTGARLRSVSPLDIREGIPGIALEQLPLSLGPVRIAGREGMAVGLSMGGLAVLDVIVGLDTLHVGFVVVDPFPAVARSNAGQPALTVGGAGIELPLSVPPQYASLGPLVHRIEPDGSMFAYGLRLQGDPVTHRSEVWNFMREGNLPGTERSSGHLVRADRLHDAGADFCRLGVLPGDFVQIHSPSACKAQPAGALQARIVEVLPDTLVLDPDSVRLDVPVTLANQKTFDPKQLASVPRFDPACFSQGGVRYRVRAPGWLVHGSRTGLLSSREPVDGRCRALTPLEGSGGRLAESVPNPAVALACPLPVDVTPTPAPKEPQKPTLLVPPFSHPVFGAKIVPGCLNEPGAGGQAQPRLLPSIRDATWTTGVTSGFQPRRSAVGSTPIAVQGGPKLLNVYVIDQGTGAIEAVELLTGTVLHALE